LTKIASPYPIDSERILRRREVELQTGLSRSTIYVMMAAGTFPKAAKLGKRAVGWPASEVRAWMQTRINGLA